VVLQGAIDEGDPVVAARDVIVVLVGYNDLLLDTPDTEALDDLVEASSRWRCAVWMELPERPGGQPSVNPKVSPEAVAAWNDRLATAIEPHEDVHLVGDWRDVVARNSAADLLSDGVHPTEAGQRRLADAYRAAIERHC
jgi:lysophospholipase L1-like esterase